MFRSRYALLVCLALGPLAPRAPAEDADAKTLADAGIAADKPDALLEYFRVRTVNDEQRGEILSLIRAMGDDSFAARQEATAEMIRYGLPAVGLLRKATEGPDFEIALRATHCLDQIEKVPSALLSAAVARRLAELKPENTAEVLLAHLPYADNEAAGDAIRDTLSAVAIRDKAPNSVIVNTAKSGSEPRSGAAAEALVRGGATDAFGLVRGLMNDDKTDPDKRARLAIALVTAAGAKSAVPLMIRLMTEGSLQHAWQVEAILCRLEEKDRPKETVGSNRDDRIKSRDAWLSWWVKNGETVELAKLKDGPRVMGYTLILQMDNSNSNGSVVELGADKKVRWRIDGLNFPIDIDVLGEDRFLIAEHNGHQISERDRQGRVLWQHRVLMPVSVKRLKDGNTFVAARNQLYIFDKDKKQVWNMPRNQHDIVCARYLPNDQIVFMTNSGRCVRVDKKTKKIEKEFAVGRVQYWSSIDVLPGDKVLVTGYNSVMEYDLKTGKKLDWSKSVNGPTCVQRLINGNTLINATNETRIFEVAQDGSQKWEYRPVGARPWKAFRR